MNGPLDVILDGDLDHILHSDPDYNVEIGNRILVQECIPVGCLPTAAVAASRCQWGGGFSVRRGVSVQVWSLSRDSLSRGVSVRRVLHPDRN